MLNFDDVQFAYQGSQDLIIENLSFEVEDGEFICIIGASGCGKSTIFRLLNGLEKGYGGEIRVNGTSIKNLTSYCSYMPQKDMLFPWKNIISNVALPMEIRKIKKEKRLETASKMLNEVGLKGFEKRYPRELSGGMRQRVAFARTLCGGSDLMLLDEPFSALDSLTKISLQEWLLGQWQKLHKTILFVTHDVEEAIFLSNKIFVIRESPISNIECVEIPLPYPRKREDLQKTEIVTLKEKLIKALRQEE